MICARAKWAFIIVFGIFVAGLGFLQASALKQVQIYPDKDKLDVLLMLDSAFGGEVGTTNIQNEKITIISGVSSPSKWSKTFTTSPIKKLELISKNGNLYIMVDSRKAHYIKPSITKDRNTIRLSFFASDNGIINNLLQAPTTIKPAPIKDMLEKDLSAGSAVSAGKTGAANVAGATSMAGAGAESKKVDSSKSNLANLDSSAQNLSAKAGARSTTSAFASATSANANPYANSYAMHAALDSSSFPSAPNATGANANTNAAKGANTAGAPNTTGAFAENLKDSFNSDDYLIYSIGFVGIIAALLLLRAFVLRRSSLNDAIKVVSQSQIDAKNKVIILETKDFFYMVLLGDKGNVLLDKIARAKEAESTPSYMPLSQALQQMQSAQSAQPNNAQNTRQNTPKTTPSTTPKQRPITQNTIANEKAFGEDFWNSLQNIKK